MIKYRWLKATETESQSQRQYNTYRLEIPASRHYSDVYFYCNIFISEFKAVAWLEQFSLQIFLMKLQRIYQLLHVYGYALAFLWC